MLALALCERTISHALIKEFAQRLLSDRKVSIISPRLFILLFSFFSSANPYVHTHTLICSGKRTQIVSWAAWRPRYIIRHVCRSTACTKFRSSESSSVQTTLWLEAHVRGRRTLFHHCLFKHCTVTSTEVSIPHLPQCFVVPIPICLRHAVAIILRISIYLQKIMNLMMWNIQYIVFALISIEYMSKRIMYNQRVLECFFNSS